MKPKTYHRDKASATCRKGHFTGQGERWTSGSTLQVTLGLNAGRLALKLQDNTFVVEYDHHQMEQPMKVKPTSKKGRVTMELDRKDESLLSPIRLRVEGDCGAD